jgi:STAS-like domain of unknown function (DUF4325)
MALIFTLGEFGRTFATRERGTELRDELIRRAGVQQDAVIDFAGVTNVSYSFADEFVGKLHADGDLHVRLENAVPRVARVVTRAVERRATCPVSG